MQWLPAIPSMSFSSSILTPCGKILISGSFISCTDKCHYFSLCPSADAFHRATDWAKETHSNALFTLLCIAHTLPLACGSKTIKNHFFLGNVLGREVIRSFHRAWPLDGWNDGIIQPVRDAVLNYYKVRARLSPPGACAKSNSTELYLFPEPALCRSIRRQRIHASQWSILVSLPVLIVFLR